MCTQLSICVCASECERACNSWTAEGGACGRFSDDLVQAVIAVEKWKCFSEAHSTYQTWVIFTNTHTPSHTHNSQKNTWFSNRWSAPIMKCRLKSISCENLAIIWTHTYCTFTIWWWNHTFCIIFSCGRRAQQAWTEHDSSNSDDKYTSERDP